MGIQLFSDDKTASPNPDPKKFTILDLKEYPGDEIITVVKVYYPGCTTHGGNKILVFEASEEEIRGRAELDPHFMDCAAHGLIARFPATRQGWADAEQYAEWKME